MHLNLDDAWSSEQLGLSSLDLREWGPRLRFSAPPHVIEKFYRECNARFAAFNVFGSGDFHHLSGLLVRRVKEPVILISFDNHPDWDIRPPKWCCGSWVNRALEVPQVRKVSVWGCGNFECWWPTQLFGNRRAERQGTLEVHPWADDRSEKDRQRRGAIFQDDWKEKFETFVGGLIAPNFYVTIDMDCLRSADAVTNWENGRFEIVDLLWALQRLRDAGRIIGGDICGAFSEARYARWKQKFASEMDHPKLKRPGPAESRQINLAAFQSLWPALTNPN